jgi:hypothetical protein
MFRRGKTTVRTDKTKLPLAVAVLLSVWLLSRSLHAELYPVEALDVTLLRADALIFATVEGLSAEGSTAQGGSTRVDLSLADLRVVASRWQQASGVERLRVVGMMLDAGNAAASGLARVRLPGHGSLEVGGRYLLLLQGGPYRSAPLLSQATAIYRVEDGFATCDGGGFVYALSSAGFVCDAPDQHATPPLNEDVLAKLLQRRVADARARRPELASHFDALRRTLQSQPEL